MPATKQRNATTRTISLLYIIAVAFIVTQDIPRGTVSTPNTTAIIYVVLFNLLLTVNIVKSAVTFVEFTLVNALYIAALAGFFMSLVAYNMAMPGQSIGVAGAVFVFSLLYIAGYTVILAVHGLVTGRS